MFEESMSIPGIWASMNSWFTPTVLFVLLNVMIGTIAVTSGLGAQKHPNQQQQQQQHEQQDEKTREDSHQHQQQHHHHQQQHQQQQQQQQELELNRSPSVLQRLKSINFYAYSYRSQEPISIPTPETHTREIDHGNHQPEQPHEVEEMHTHEDEEEEQTYEQEQDIGEGEKTMEEVYGQLQRSHNRTKSETKPASGEVLVKLPRKMRKSASAKSAFSHFEEDDIVESRRPATVREGIAKVTAEVDDDNDDDDDGDEDDEEVDAKADDFINRFKHQLKLQRLDSIVRYKEMVNRGSSGK